MGLGLRVGVTDYNAINDVTQGGDSYLRSLTTVDSFPYTSTTLTAILL